MGGTQANLALSFAVIVTLFFARRAVLALVNRRFEDSTLRYRWAKVVGRVAFMLTALILFLIWFTALRSLEDSGVLLTLRYICRPRERRATAGVLWEQILDAFSAAPDVTLAYPTQRINIGREVLSSSHEEEPIEADDQRRE